MLCYSEQVMAETSRLSLLLTSAVAQVDAYGGEDDRPSSYQPRTLSTGLSGGATSYSSPQLTAAHGGSEEVRCCICQGEAAHTESWLWEKHSKPVQTHEANGWSAWLLQLAGASHG